MDQTDRLPLRIPRLVGWFLLLYLTAFHLSDFVRADSLLEELRLFMDVRNLVMLVFTGLAFFAYSLVSYLIFWRFYNRVPWFWLLGMLLVGIIACMFWRPLMEEVIAKALTGQGNYNPNMSWRNYLLDQILYALYFTPLGIVFYLVERSRFYEERRTESEALRVETELKFLRSQVNPHFLFNTLNNVYSLVHRSSPQALPALEKLSGLLRYALYERQELVPIAKEIDYLRDLIHLERMRLPDAAPVIFEVDDFARAWCLPPLLLVPFVENAFKHGDLRKEPLRVRLTERAGQLHFHCGNLVRQNAFSKDATGGIGLTNVRQRLELLYPGEYDLEITQRKGYFTVNLHIMRAAERGCRERTEQPAIPSPELSPKLQPNAPFLPNR